MRDTLIKYEVTKLYKERINIGGTESFKTVEFADIRDDMSNTITGLVEKLRKAD